MIAGGASRFTNMIVEPMHQTTVVWVLCCRRKFYGNMTYQLLSNGRAGVTHPILAGPQTYFHSKATCACPRQPIWHERTLGCDRVGSIVSRRVLLPEARTRAVGLGGKPRPIRRKRDLAGARSNPSYPSASHHVDGSLAAGFRRDPIVLCYTTEARRPNVGVGRGRIGGLLLGHNRW
jgi:hypothetical protein